ncbi:MAG: DUF4254 domain-containing protein [Candidatus Omnitrophica bacterium]|nr:DUF4254 domain-containing protein [Candidatus Omnitrophota bacterium]
MAETLGSLIDKLTIKDLRQHNLKSMLNSKNKKFSASEIKKKLVLIKAQRQDLIQEIDDFIIAAARGKVKIREEKLKLYNAPEHIGRIPASKSIAKIISALAGKNLELWNLEDEARRKDVSDAYIGRIKRKIDLANQQRNDLIDGLDELLEKCLKKSISSS